MDSFVVFNILLFVLFNFFSFLPISFSEVETASEMTKTMLEWVFYLLPLLTVAFVNWPAQFILSLNQNKMYKGIENTVVCLFDMLDNAHF